MHHMWQRVVAYMCKYKSISLPKELEYCEFFAGAGNVFKEVKGAAYPATAVDIEYLKDFAHAGRTNPFDFMTPAGFA